MLHDGQTAFQAPNFGTVKPGAVCTPRFVTKNDDRAVKMILEAMIDALSRGNLVIT